MKKKVKKRLLITIALLLATSVIIGGVLWWMQKIDRTAGTSENIEQEILPDDIENQKGEFADYIVPPSGYTTATAWMDIVYDDTKTGDAIVQIDWLRIYALVDGEEVLLAGNEYDDNVFDGALFDRYPVWYGDWREERDVNDIIPYTFDSGHVMLPVSQIKDRVWHVWNTQFPRAKVPPNAQHVWSEARIKVIGSGLAQVGLDFYISEYTEFEEFDVSNKEAGASDYFGETGGWQVITTIKS